MTSKHRLAILRGFRREGPNLVASGCTNPTPGGDPCGECEACEATCAFTWVRCDVCGAKGGPRHAVAKIFPGTKSLPIYYSACEDCYVFAANGILPGDDS